MAEMVELNNMLTPDQRAAAEPSLKMLASTPMTRQLRNMYLAQPNSARRQNFFATLSDVEQRELAKALIRHRDMLSGNPSMPESAQGNPVLQELEYDREQLMSVYDEHLHYWYPQETAADRKCQNIAAMLSALGMVPPSIEKCREESQEFIGGIVHSHKKLEAMVLQHESLIRSRWRKKTKAQRAEVLLTAYPEMPRIHRPDMAMYTPADKNLTAKSSGVLTWPHINLEDLLLPNTLLIFINARARHPPAKFAYADLELAPLMKTRKELLALRKDNVTMSFFDGNSREDYVQLVEWNSPDEQQQSLCAGRTTHVDHGMQILCYQRDILDFLVKCTSQLVGDMKILDLHRISTLPPEPPSLTSNVDGPMFQHIAAREAPYRLPTELDLGRLQALTSAQKRQAIEHAWALREDPSYFADAVEEQRDHRNELMLGLEGEVHEHAQDFPLYTKALRHLIMDSYFSVFLWDHTSKSLSDIRKLSVKYADAIRVQADLPAELFDTLTDLRFFLETISLDIITMIKTYFKASPPLRKYLYRASPNDGNKRVSIIMPRHTGYNYEDETLNHLLRLIDLFSDKGFRELFTLHVIMDEIESFMQSNARAKALVSPFMARLISQVALIAECLHQLHCFQPWARKIESEIEENRTKFSARYDAFIRSWGRIDMAHRGFEKPDLCRLGSPRDGKFEYPVNERRTRANFDKMRKSEAALDNFWNAANTYWLGTAGCTPGELIKDIVGERVLLRTPAWVEPPKIPKSVNSPSKNTEPVLPFSGHVHDESKNFTGSFSKKSVAAKQKEKTHGSAEVNAEVEPTVPIEDLSPAYTVDKRAFKVFRNLFHSPDSPDQPGQIIWTDFLHAMISVGFGAEKLQGSAWHFTPSTMAAERSIQFHEPHPSNKLPITWARRYGRRLNRAFGWTGSSFKLD